MKRHGIGIIGYGGFGEFLYKTWSEMANVKITAIADMNPDITIEGVRFYQNWQDLLEDPDVEIVSICTPPSSHALIGCEAMMAGKHILVEKPIATSVDDGQKLVNIRNETGRIAAVNFMLRFNPLIVTLVSFAQSGYFGKLRRAAVENYAQDEQLPENHWFWDKTISGGILVEHAVHFIDLIEQLVHSEIECITGMAHQRNEKQEDQVLASMRYKNGLIATHYHEFARPSIFESTSIRLVFDCAEFNLDGWIPLEGNLKALVNDESLEFIATLPGYILESIVPLIGNQNNSESSMNVDVFCGGLPFKVNNMITATFGLYRPKLQIYAECLRSMMSDIIAAIENVEYKIISPLEAGINALKHAIAATERS